jgi:uncharacterized membrane protein
MLHMISKCPSRRSAVLVAGSILLLGLGACQGAKYEPAPVYDGIGAEEVIHFTGTEPFWGGQAVGSILTYTTPENPAGEVFAIQRFAGNSGLGLSGSLDDQLFDMTVTPGECSDGMSDRIYPLTVTLGLAGEVREGCGWTDRLPFIGPEYP